MKSDWSSDMVAGLLVGPITVVLVGVYSAWEGWVLSVLWRWFAVPVFHLPPITISVGVGLALIAGLLTHQYALDPKEAAPGQRVWRFFSPFITGLVYLTIGSVCKP